MYHEKRIPVDTVEFLVKEVKEGRGTDEPAVDAAIEILGVANRWRPGYDDIPIVGQADAIAGIESVDKDKDTESVITFLLPYAIQLAISVLRARFGKLFG